MFCKNCGAKNNNYATNCRSCGQSLQDVVIVNNNQTGKRCPKCVGYNCQSITDTQTESKPYGLGEGCCGYLLFGGWGLLCGLCGAESKTRTKHYWLCPSCGNKFKK